MSCTSFLQLSRSFLHTACVKRVVEACGRGGGQDFISRQRAGWQAAEEGLRAVVSDVYDQAGVESVAGV